MSDDDFLLGCERFHVRTKEVDDLALDQFPHHPLGIHRRASGVAAAGRSWATKALDLKAIEPGVRDVSSTVRKGHQASLGVVLVLVDAYYELTSATLAAVDEGEIAQAVLAPVFEDAAKIDAFSLRQSCKFNSLCHDVGSIAGFGASSGKHRGLFGI